MASQTFLKASSFTRVTPEPVFCGDVLRGVYAALRKGLILGMRLRLARQRS